MMSGKPVFSLTELGRVLGVSAQSMSKWSKLGGFPLPDGERWEAWPVLEWWLIHKASRAVQRGLIQRVCDAIKAPSPDFPSDEQMSESDRLDLALKEHKLNRLIGDSVSFADVKEIVGTLATEIRQACESAKAATGHDVMPMFNAAFDRFDESLQKQMAELESMN
jgi:hypothetical protein